MIFSCLIRSWRSRRSVPCRGDLPAWGNNLRLKKRHTRTAQPSSISSREPCRYAWGQTTNSPKRTRCLWDLQVYLCFTHMCDRFCVSASSVFHSEWPGYVCDGFKGPKQSNRLPLFNLAVLQRECTAWQIHCNLVSICDYSFPTTMSNLAWQFLCMLFSCVLLSFGWWGKFAVRHVHICCFNRGSLEENFIPGCARLCGVRTYFTLLIFTGSVELGGDSVEQQQQQQAGGPQQSTVAFQPRNHGKNRFFFFNFFPLLSS